jgi:hypothetical protein
VPPLCSVKCKHQVYQGSGNVFTTLHFICKLTNGPKKLDSYITLTGKIPTEKAKISYSIFLVVKNSNHLPFQWCLLCAHNCTLQACSVLLGEGL